MSSLKEVRLYELAKKLERLTRDGPVLGMYVCVTANQERGVPTRIAGQMTIRLIMKMADPNSYLSLGLANVRIPALKKGRAISLDNSDEIQLVRYSRGLETRLASLPAKTDTPPAVTTLGSVVERSTSSVAERSTRSGDYWKLILGVAYESLEASSLELQAGTSAIVSGSSGAGKTETLRRLLLEILAADPDTQIVVVTPPNVEERPIAVKDFSPDMLEPNRPSFILVDDVRSVSDESAQNIELAAGENDVWVIVTARPESLTSPAMWVRRLAMTQTAVFLNPKPGHGDIVRMRLPQSPTAVDTAGRGFVTTGNSSEYVQLFRAEPSTVFEVSGTGEEVTSDSSDLGAS